MSRYIDADELIFFGFDNPDCDNLFEFVPKEFIDNAPTADVVERKRGEWLYKDMKGQFCSVCDKKSVWKFDFCPNCGAEMRERREDEHTD